jgi:uridine kinase
MPEAAAAPANPPPVVAFTELAAEVLRRPPRLGAIRLVAIDGHGGAGKTTFAARLARALEDTPILHTDDFASWAEPHQWWPRFEANALQPLARGEPARFRTSSWALGHGGEERVVAPAKVMLVEGVSSARLAVADRLTLAVWVEAPWSDSLRRGVERDGEAARDAWRRWRVEEEAHYAADPTRDRADVVVDGAPTLPHDPEREFVRLR